MNPGVKRIAEISDDRPVARIGSVTRGTLHLAVQCTGEGVMMVSYDRSGVAFPTHCGEDGVTEYLRGGFPEGAKNLVVRVKKTNPDQRVRALVGWTDRAKRPKWLPKQTNPAV